MRRKRSEPVVESVSDVVEADVIEVVETVVEEPSAPELRLTEVEMLRVENVKLKADLGAMTQAFWKAEKIVATRAMEDMKRAVERAEAEITGAEQGIENTKKEHESVVLAIQERLGVELAGYEWDSATGALTPTKG